MLLLLSRLLVVSRLRRSSIDSPPGLPVKEIAEEVEPSAVVPSGSWKLYLKGYLIEYFELPKTFCAAKKGKGDLFLAREKDYCCIPPVYFTMSEQLGDYEIPACP